MLLLLPAEKLHEAYNSSGAYPVYKNIVRFDGDHNHPRPAFFYSSVCCFFHQQLKLELVLVRLLPGCMYVSEWYGVLHHVITWCMASSTSS
jgi:hypothetical protein